MTVFFADTFAILALLQGDERYVKRFRAAPFETGLLNVMEAYYLQVLREVSDPEARQNLEPFDEVARAPDRRVLEAAVRFRLSMRGTKRPMTFTHAVGYAQARADAVPFLTGDSMFQGLEGVEFLEPELPRRR